MNSRSRPAYRTIFIAGLACAAMAVAFGACEFVVQPGDLDVDGHLPDAEPLLNHYALENSVSFQIRIYRGACVSNVCRGGANDGQACPVAGCATGPLNFSYGQTEIFDAAGTMIDAFPFTDVDFEAGASLEDVGICNADSTVRCTLGTDATACGMSNPACDARPSPGYVPDGANLRFRNPKELIAHNLVPDEAVLRICFAEFDGPGGCDELVVRERIKEYRVPAGQTYIYPMPPPNSGGERLRNSEAHEHFSHHRDVNNQRHAHDVLSRVNDKETVASSCVDSACEGGARDGNSCSDASDCLDNANYFVYQEPIIAMADGTVVALTQGFPENPNPPGKLAGIGLNNCRVVSCGNTVNCLPGEVPVVGNSVFIQHANGEVSMAAHVIPGSNDHLSCGDPVQQGDQLGLTGNSGNSTAPHLHYSTDVLPSFWSSANYSLPSYYTNVGFASGSDATIRRQLDVSMRSFFFFDVLAPVSPIPANAASPSGAVPEVEPNDTLASHNALTLPTVVVATLEDLDVGDLAVRGDGIEDVFRVDLGAPDSLRVDLVGEAENLDVYALTEDLRVLNDTGQGTSPGATEAVCLELDAGAHYLMVTNVDPTQTQDVDYTLEVASDPPTLVCSVTNATQPIEVTSGCEAVVEFEVAIKDNCCLDPATLNPIFTVSSPENPGAFIVDLVLDPFDVVSSTEITVTGTATIGGLDEIPATVKIDVTAQDCTENTISSVDHGSACEVGVQVTEPPPAQVSGDTYVRKGDANDNEGASTFIRMGSFLYPHFLDFEKDEIDPNGNLHCVDFTATLEMMLLEAKVRGSDNTRSICVHVMESEWEEGNGFNYDNPGGPMPGSGSGATWNCAIDQDISNDITECVIPWGLWEDDPKPWNETPTECQDIVDEQTGVLEYDVTPKIVETVNGETISGFAVRKEGNKGADLVFGTREGGAGAAIVIELD